MSFGTNNEQYLEKIIKIIYKLKTIILEPLSKC
jgi:hypothetical protein